MKSIYKQNNKEIHKAMLKEIIDKKLKIRKQKINNLIDSEKCRKKINKKNKSLSFQDIITNIKEYNIFSPTMLIKKTKSLIFTTKISHKIISYFKKLAE